MQTGPPTLATTHSGSGLNSVAHWLSESLEHHKGVVLAVFSMAYFGLTFYRASRKLFWFDELFTVYLSRLPDFKSVWRFLQNSVDFQVVLFLLTWFSESYFWRRTHSDPATPNSWLLGLLFMPISLCFFALVSLERVRQPAVPAGHRSILVRV